MNKNQKNIVIVFTMSMFLGACATKTLAPAYQQPDISFADQWINESLKSKSDESVLANELDWRSYFGDPRLQKIIEVALKNNHDLRKAALSIELHQEKYGISKTSNQPIVGGNAEATRARNMGRTGNRFQVGTGFTGYEIDFFGRVKNKNEAALNEYLQTREARDSAQLSLVNAIAKTYYQLLFNEKLLQISEKILVSHNDSYRVNQSRLQQGIVAKTALTNDLSDIASAKINVTKQATAVEKTKNTLSSLVGVHINSIESLPESQPLFDQLQKMNQLFNVDSLALLSRPDIRQAEYGLKIANANIGVARASLYPSIKLTGNAGFASSELNNLFTKPSKVWSFSPSLSLPLFNRKMLQGQVKISKISQQIAVESYQSTVKNAFKEVADALTEKTSFQSQFETELKRKQVVEDNMLTVKLQIQAGVANITQLQQVERAYYGIQQSINASLLQQLVTQADLYKVLGGGLTRTSSAKID